MKVSAIHPANAMPPIIWASGSHRCGPSPMQPAGFLTAVAIAVLKIYGHRASLRASLGLPRLAFSPGARYFPGI